MRGKLNHHIELEWTRFLAFIRQTTHVLIAALPQPIFAFCLAIFPLVVASPTPSRRSVFVTSTVIHAFVILLETDNMPLA